MTQKFLRTSLDIVFRQIGRIATISTLCCAIGFHWVVLQSIAWTGMLVENSKRAPLCQAITRTFDGAHPCSLCHVVAAGKASEKRADMQSPVPKIDIICVARIIRIVSPFVLFRYSVRDFSVYEIAQSPPAPPPRVIPG